MTLLSIADSSTFEQSSQNNVPDVHLLLKPLPNGLPSSVSSNFGCFSFSLSAHASEYPSLSCAGIFQPNSFSRHGKQFCNIDQPLVKTLNHQDVDSRQKDLLALVASAGPECIQ